MYKTYERETEFFEFSQDAIREELKMEKMTSFCYDFIAMVSLQWLHIAMDYLLLSLSFVYKHTYYLS